MKKSLAVSICVCFISGFSFADTFGTGNNQFSMEFVNISGDSGNLGKWSYDPSYTFSGVNHADYRIGKFEITNEQWNKFKNAYGTVTGNPSNAYDEGSTWTGTNVPVNNISWYEAAQFVNYLNTSKGYQPAYKFTGTKGTGNYTFVPWNASDAGFNASNPYRNSNAYYFLPTENEWVKAAYWNGTMLQTYATKNNSMPIAGSQSNYNQSWPYSGPWNVGSGTEELNGTYDMMGNVYEWLESPWIVGQFLANADHSLRGGTYSFPTYTISSEPRVGDLAASEGFIYGLRIASIPEPATMLLLCIGGLMLRRKK